jgi:hypothetical protein
MRDCIPHSSGALWTGLELPEDSNCLAEAEGFSGLTEDVQPDTRPSEARDCGGACGTSFATGSFAWLDRVGLLRQIVAGSG